MSVDIPLLAMLRFECLRAVSTASLRLSERRGKIHTLPTIGRLSATHFTLIARMPGVAGTEIGQIMAGLRRLYPDHHYYPADTIHVTIRNLDDPSRTERDRRSLFGEIRNLVSGYGPFSLKGKGLGVSPNSVFLQLYPAGQDLTDLRHKLSTANRVAGRRHREGSGLLGDVARRFLFEKMAFATLIRFSGHVTPAFLAEIARHRDTEFGSFQLNAFEIVRTDKFLSKTGTETIDRMVVGHGCSEAGRQGSLRDST